MENGSAFTIISAASTVSLGMSMLLAKSLVEPHGIYPSGTLIPLFIYPVTVLPRVPSPPAHTITS